MQITTFLSTKAMHLPLYLVKSTSILNSSFTVITHKLTDYLINIVLLSLSLNKTSNVIFSKQLLFQFHIEE